MTKFSVAALVICLGLAGGALASPAVVVGSHTLDTNAPSTWTFPISISGGDLVEICNFNIQVGDGGPAFGGTLGPTIASVDLETGIFAGNYNGHQDLVDDYPQYKVYTIMTASGAVAASGVLAYVSFDPTGFTNGTWDLHLKDTLNGPTDFGPVEALITDGSITVVPEPATMSLLGLGAMALVRRRRR